MISNRELVAAVAAAIAAGGFSASPSVFVAATASAKPRQGVKWE